MICFHMGLPQVRWMVFVRENPIYEMVIMTGGDPHGNDHIHLHLRSYADGFLVD